MAEALSILPNTRVNTTSGRRDSMLHPKIAWKGEAKVDPSGPHVTPEHLNKYFSRRPIVPGGKRK